MKRLIMISAATLAVSGCLDPTSGGDSIDSSARAIAPSPEASPITRPNHLTPGDYVFSGAYKDLHAPILQDTTEGIDLLWSVGEDGTLTLTESTADCEKTTEITIGEVETAGFKQQGLIYGETTYCETGACYGVFEVYRNSRTHGKQDISYYQTSCDLSDGSGNNFFKNAASFENTDTGFNMIVTSGHNGIPIMSWTFERIK